MTVIQLENGYLDVKEDSVVPINLSIGDIRNVGTRSGMFSKTITLPGTDNNHNLLNHYYDVNIEAGTFDVNVITRCSIIQNGIPVIENAILQLVAVNNIQSTSRHYDEVTYDVFIKDDVSDLFTAIGQKELTDLDFTELDHVISSANVVASFGNDYTDGYMYLLGYNNSTDYPLTEMRPSIFVRRYLDKIFADAGYSYTWTDINTLGINNLIIPYNGDQLQVDNTAFQAEATDTHTTSTAQTTSGVGVSFQEQLTNFTEVTDPQNLFDPVLGEYEVPVDVVPGQHINFGWTIDYDVILDNVNAFDVYLVQTGVFPVFATYKLKLYTYKNGGIHAQSEISETFVTDGTTITSSTQSTIASATGYEFNTQVTNVNVGDIITFKIGVEINQASGAIKWRDGNLVSDPTVRVDVDADISATVIMDMNSNVVSSGSTIQMNSCIPKKVKQNDFLKSILKMFNCYIVPEKGNERKVTIINRDTYYDSGEVKVWTNKLAKDKPQLIQFLPELNTKRKILSYAKDEDTPNKVYTDATNEVYGQVEIVFDNEYIKGVDTDELIFSPCPVTAVTFGAFVPMISFGAPNTNIKIVYHGGTGTSTIGFNIYDHGVTGQTGLTSYPLIGHFNDPINPTFDLNFATCDFYFYAGINITNNNLYNLYHRRMYAQLNSGKMMSAYFYLTEDDIQGINLNDKIRIDNSWWNINKVIDYDANANTLTKVELISVDDEIDLPPFRVRPTIKPPIKQPDAVTGVIGHIDRNNNTIGNNADVDVKGRGNTVANDVRAFIVGDDLEINEDGVYTPKLFLPEGGTINGVDVTKLLNTNTISGDGVSINAGDNTKFDFQIVGEIIDPIDNTTTVVDVNLVAQTVTNLATHKVTYLAVKKDGTVEQKTTPFTNSELSTRLGEWVLVHSNLTSLNAVNQFPERGYALANQLHSMMRNRGMINVVGNDVSANGANLSLNISAGTLERVGVNPDNVGNPNEIDLDALIAPSNIRMRTQGDYESANTAFIDTVNYDDGTATPVAIPSANQFQTMRIARFSSNLIRVQYGQTLYSSMSEAIANLTDDYIVEKNIAENGCIIGLLIVRKNTTDLSDTSRAKFIKVGMNGATNASLVPTFQNVYEVSPQPQIVTNSTNGAVQIEGGTGNDADINFEILNNAGTSKVTIAADGSIKTDAIAHEFKTTDTITNIVDRVTSDPAQSLGFVTGISSRDLDNSDVSRVDVTPDNIFIGSTDGTNSSEFRAFKVGRTSRTTSEVDLLTMNPTIISGTGQASREVKESYVVNTTNATPTNVGIASLIHGTKTVFYTNVQIIGVDSAGGGQYYYANLRAAFYRVAGVITQIGATELFERKTFSTATTTVLTDGANIIPQVTGEAATSIDWTITITSN